METIMVCMDFTETACNALKYALKYADGNPVYAVYIESDILDLREPSELMANYNYTGDIRMDMQDMIRKELKYESFPTNLIKLDIILGPFEDMVNKFIAENEVDILFAGLRDKYSLLNKFFGTHATELVKRVSVPVYLIPRFSKYTKYKTVVIGTDKSINDIIFLDKLTKWNENYKAHLNFLHISEDEVGKDRDIINEAVISRFFEEKGIDFTLQISSLNDPEIANALVGYAYNHNADILLLIPSKKNTLQEMIKGSISRQVITQSKIPICFLR